MGKLSLFIFTTTVLVGGTAALLACLPDAKKPVIPENFIFDPLGACWNIETKFNPARQNLKNCLGFETDISKLESLYHEFCAPNSDFRKKLERHRLCIALNILKVRDCRLENYLHQLSLESEYVYNKCRSVSVDMSKCLTDKIGGPCGAEGMEVYGRMAEASEPFLTGTCMFFAKHLIGSTGRNLMDEIAELEQKDVETSLAENEQNEGYTSSAATEHSAVTWCILMGLLCVAKW